MPQKSLPNLILILAVLLVLAGVGYWQLIRVPNNQDSDGLLSQYDSPKVTTLPINESDISVYFAIAEGEVIPNSPYSYSGGLVAWFEYGESESLAGEIMSSNKKSFTDNGWGVSSKFDGLLSGLKNGTRYYYRAAVKNNFGTFYGEILQFETVKFIPPPPPKPYILKKDQHNLPSEVQVNRFLPEGTILVSALPLNFDGKDFDEIAMLYYYPVLKFPFAYDKQELYDPRGEIRTIDLEIGLKIISYDMRNSKWQMVPIEGFDFTKFGNFDLPEKGDLTKIDQNKDGREELLMINLFSGTGVISSLHFIAEVDGKLKKVLTEENLKSPKTGLTGSHNTTFIEGDFIKESFPIYLDNDGNCCPSGGVYEIKYQFDGKKLKIVSQGKID